MESNYILKFFIGTLIFLVLGVLQMIARKLLIIWFPLPIQDFQDLCCLANVSMIFFDHNLHGNASSSLSRFSSLHSPASNRGKEITSSITAPSDFYLKQALRGSALIAAAQASVLIFSEITSLSPAGSPRTLSSAGHFVSAFTDWFFLVGPRLPGYYLHGKTPAGVAEGDLQWLAQVLEKEGK